MKVRIEYLFPGQEELAGRFFAAGFALVMGPTASITAIRGNSEEVSLLGMSFETAKAALELVDAEAIMKRSLSFRVEINSHPV